MNTFSEFYYEILPLRGNFLHFLSAKNAWKTTRKLVIVHALNFSQKDSAENIFYVLLPVGDRGGSLPPGRMERDKKKIEERCGDEKKSQ